MKKATADRHERGKRIAFGTGRVERNAERFLSRQLGGAAAARVPRFDFGFLISDFGLENGARSGGTIVWPQPGSSMFSRSSQRSGAHSFGRETHTSMERRRSEWPTDIERK